MDADGNYVPPKTTQECYVATKAANVFLATEFARRNPLKGNRGIITNSWNPGNLQSELQRHTPWWQMVFIKLLLYPAVYGGYTELFAGWAEEAGHADKNGAFIAPWGRFSEYRPDVKAETQKEGGNAEKFWEWCERTTKGYS